MKVRTLKPHNACGADRAIGEEYEHPNPKGEITLGFVENADDDKVEGSGGAGTKTGSSEGRDSKEQDAKGSKGSGRASSKKG